MQPICSRIGLRRSRVHWDSHEMPVKGTRQLESPFASTPDTCSPGNLRPRCARNLRARADPRTNEDAPHPIARTERSGGLPSRGASGHDRPRAGRPASRLSLPDTDRASHDGPADRRHLRDPPAGWRVSRNTYGARAGSAPSSAGDRRRDADRHGQSGPSPNAPPPSDRRARASAFGSAAGRRWRIRFDRSAARRARKGTARTGSEASRLVVTRNIGADRSCAEHGEPRPGPAGLMVRCG